MCGCSRQSTWYFKHLAFELRSSSKLKRQSVGDPQWDSALPDDELDESIEAAKRSVSRVCTVQGGMVHR